jgi:hypothetical protein
MSKDPITYSLRSFDFLINTIGLDLDLAKGRNQLEKNRECDFHLDPFLAGITNGEYIIAVYNVIRYLTNPSYTRAINLAENAVFYNLLENSFSLFKDELTDWEFNEFDGLDCWKLYVVCARNQDLPLWTNEENEPVRKPSLKSLKVEDWEYIFEIIEEELFDDYAWLEVNNYKKLDDKLIIPTDQEYEEALKWLYNAYANTWVNKSRLFMKEENNDKNISNKI